MSLAIDPTAAFLESAADLLAEPDPGPTPFLVEQLLVEQAIAAVQGAPKVGKTWMSLELAVSIVTGLPAFGQFEVLQGPVVMILEESGRAALHRRLGALARGRAIKPDQLRDLHFAANRRVRLNDQGWRDRILSDTAKLKPRLISFDPLVRVKGAGTRENDQDEMGPILDFLRDLREATEASVAFIHHTGHDGHHLRGTSDLEGYWESKIALVKKPDRVAEVTAEHREAEASEPFDFRQAWDQYGSVRLALIGVTAEKAQTLDEAVVGHLREHAGDHADGVAKGIGKRAADVRKRLAELADSGTIVGKPSRYTDAAGRARTRTGYFLNGQGTLYDVPTDGTGNGRGSADAVDRPEALPSEESLSAGRATTEQSATAVPAIYDPMGDRG